MIIDNKIFGGKYTMKTTLKNIAIAIIAITLALTLFACANAPTTPVTFPSNPTNGQNEDTPYSPPSGYTVAGNFVPYQAYSRPGIYLTKEKYVIDKEKEVFDEGLTREKSYVKDELRENSSKVIEFDNKEIAAKYYGSVDEYSLTEGGYHNFDSFDANNSNDDYLQILLSTESEKIISIKSHSTPIIPFTNWNGGDEAYIAEAKVALIKMYGYAETDFDAYETIIGTEGDGTGGTLTCVYFINRLSGYVTYSRMYVSFDPLIGGITWIYTLDHAADLAPFADLEIDEETLDAVIDEAAHGAVDPIEGIYLDGYTKSIDLIVLNGQLFAQVRSRPTVRWIETDELADLFFDYPYEVMIPLT
jgi:hypothetical protein